MQYVTNLSMGKKNLFKVQDSAMDFNIKEYKKFIDADPYST